VERAMDGASPSFKDPALPERRQVRVWDPLGRMALPQGPFFLIISSSPPSHPTAPSPLGGGNAVAAISGERWMTLTIVNDMGELPVMLTVQQMARALQLSRVKSYRLVRRPGFPVVRFGRAIRIPRDALVRWLDHQLEVCPRA
jgi:excisionase family DNA binding protein